MKISLLCLFVGAFLSTLAKTHTWVTPASTTRRSPTWQMTTTTSLFSSTVEKNLKGATNSTADSPSLQEAMEDLGKAARGIFEDVLDAPERFRKKQELILLGAGYDRGFGASESARKKAKALVKDLMSLNPSDNVELHMTTDEHEHASDEEEEESLLKGSWRLVWTTARNVLALNASPLLTVSAIHLVVEPPVMTSILDFVPRYESLLPPDGIPVTMTRAKIKNKAVMSSSSSSGGQQAAKFKLQQESVYVKPVDILGRKAGSRLPALAFNVPKLPGASSSDQSQKSLTVLYVDKDMLITDQVAPGGINVFVKVDDAEA